MNDFSDSGELFTVRNQFYTGQHQKVLAYALESFSQDAQPKVLEYQIRAAVALTQDASDMIDAGKAQFPDHEHVFLLLSAWNDLVSLHADHSPYFEGVSDAEFETQAVLAALYLVRIRRDVDSALAVLQSYAARAAPWELECHLLSVQLHLYKGNFSAASRIFDSLHALPVAARDDIVFHVLESWVLAVRGESDNIHKAYYFYDELLSTDLDSDPQGKFHILSVLFAMTLQLKHFPEATELLAQIEALDFSGAGNADLIANKITFEYLQNAGADVEQLLQQLAAADADHQMLQDFKEKNERFDAIVEKYQH